MTHLHNITKKASIKGAFFVVFLLSLTSAVAQELTANDLLQKAESCLQKAEDSALYYAEKALELSKVNNDFSLEIKANGLLGDFYQNRTQPEKATEYYLKSIRIAEQNNLQTLAAKAFNGLGMIAYERGEIDQSMGYLQKAASLKKQAGELSHYAMILTNVSAIYFSQGKYDLALQTLQNAEKDLPENNEAKATLYNSIGGIFQAASNNLDSAAWYYQKSIALSERFNFEKVLISAYTNLGDVMVAKGETSRGIAMMEKALKKSEELQRFFHVQQIASAIASAYEKNNDFVNALRFKQKELEAKDRLFDEQKSEAVERLKIQFESEQKEFEIQTLRSKWQRTIIIGLSVLLIAVLVLILFYQNRKSKQAVIDAKNQLLQNLIHDIRTPVSLITGPVKWYKETGDLQRFSSQLKLIEKNAERLEWMITDLLSVNKIDAGKFETEWAFGNPLNAIKEWAESFSSVMEVNDQTIEYSKIGEASNVMFPHKVLSSVLQNLLNNAVKYAGVGAAISMSAEVKLETLVLHLRDNGPGLSDSERKFVFQRFFRGTNAFQSKGVGLGLSLVKDMVEKSGGNIKLLPSEKGLHFEVLIPLRTSKLQEIESTSKEKPQLLIIEDDVDLASFVADVLSDDYDLKITHSAEQAWDRIIDEIPDIVLTDIKLGLTSGIDFLEKLKSDDLIKHIPVLVFSAYNSQEVKNNALFQGAAAFITKPFHPEELKLQVNSIWKELCNAREHFQRSSSEDKPMEIKLPARDPFLQKAAELILEHLDNTDFGPDQLANLLAISRSQLHRKLVALSGWSTSHFIRITRLEKSRDFLQEKKHSVKEIAYMVGFSSPSYFSKSYKDHFGVSPGEDAGFQ